MLNDGPILSNINMNQLIFFLAVLLLGNLWMMDCWTNAEVLSIFSGSNVCVCVTTNCLGSVTTVPNHLDNILNHHTVLA